MAAANISLKIIYIFLLAVSTPAMFTKFAGCLHWPHSEKQDRRRRHFFENYLHFSAGCVYTSYVHQICRMSSLGVSFLKTEISLILKKQDGRRRQFFENYLHFSTGCFS